MQVHHATRHSKMTASQTWVLASLRRINIPSGSVSVCEYRYCEDCDEWGCVNRKYSSSSSSTTGISRLWNHRDRSFGVKIMVVVKKIVNKNVKIMTAPHGNPSSVDNIVHCCMLSLLVFVIISYHLLSFIITYYHLLWFIIIHYNLFSFIIIGYHLSSSIIIYHLSSFVNIYYHSLSLIIIYHHLLSFFTCVIIF